MTMGERYGVNGDTIRMRRSEQSNWKKIYWRLKKKVIVLSPEKSIAFQNHKYDYNWLVISTMKSVISDGQNTMLIGASTGRFHEWGSELWTSRVVLLHLTILICHVRRECSNAIYVQVIPNQHSVDTGIDTVLSILFQYRLSKSTITSIFQVHENSPIFEIFLGGHWALFSKLLI